MSAGASPRQVPNLLERDGELAVLDAAVGRPGSLVLIEGTPGVGKTSLVVEAARRARLRDQAVLSASGREWQRQQPFALLADLFSGPVAGARGGAVLEDLAGAARALVERPPPSPHEELGVFHRLFPLVSRLRSDEEGRGPVVLTVDDAHWCDDASLRFLLDVAARRDQLAVVLIVALLPGEPDAGALLSRIRGQSAARLLCPGPLSEPAVCEVVRGSLPAPTGAFCRACAEVTGGNPFFLAALLEALAAGAVVPDDEGAARVRHLVPDAVARSVLLRLGRLPCQVRDVARAAAVLGEGARLAHAARLAGVDEITAEAAADILSGAHFLQPGEPLSFVHPVVASAVLSDVPAFARSRWHREAARLLAGEGAPATEVGAHLLSCRPAGDQWVVDQLGAAAAAATTDGDHRLAARLLQRAWHEPPDEAARPRLLVAAALAAAANEEPDADQRLAAAIELIDDPEQRGQAYLDLARLLIVRGDFGSAAAAADRGLAAAASPGVTQPEAPERAVNQALLNTWLAATSRHAPRRGEALKRLDALTGAARRGQFPDDPGLCARVACRLATSGDDPALVRAVAEAALRRDPLVDPTAHGIPFAFVTAGIYWIDDYGWCDQAATAALKSAEERGSSVAAMAATHWQAAAWLEMGRLEDAAAAAGRSLAIRGGGWDALVGWTGAVLVTIHLERGDLTAARVALEAAESADPESLDWAFVLLAGGRVNLEEGDPAAALRRFVAAGEHLAGTFRIDHPGVLPWRSFASLATARLGRMEEARRLADEAVRRARRLGLRRPLGDALRLAAEVAPKEAGLAMCEEAVGCLRGTSAALVYAHALVDLGAAYRRANRLVDARGPLGDGLRLAESFGALPLRQRAERELHAVGGRRRRAGPVMRSAAALTPTQHRVARLAAEGLTNSQIARQLYVSTKTVEWHLAEVFRRLRITGRRQLAEVVREHDDTNLAG